MNATIAAVLIVGGPVVCFIAMCGWAIASIRRDARNAQAAAAPPPAVAGFGECDEEHDQHPRRFGAGETDL